MMWPRSSASAKVRVSLADRSTARSRVGRLPCGSIVSPVREPDSYVFLFHHVASLVIGAGRTSGPSTLVARWATTAVNARTRRHVAGPGVDFRLYDARHTFVTRLAENPTVSEETIRQLAGHVNPRMLARYSHIRAKARREAIATLEGSEAETSTNFGGGSPQNPHSRGIIGTAF